MSVNLDIFDPRVMLDAVRQMKPAQRFFLDNFFPESDSFDTINVDVDIYKDKRRIAPFDNPLMEGKIVDDLGFKTRSYKPAYCKPKKRTTAQHLLRRTPGETLYAGKDPQTRAAEKLGTDFAELDQMIARREEWMALQGLQTGAVVIDGDGDKRTVDFDFDSNHLVTNSGTSLWSDTTNSDPINDLLTWRRLVLRDCGLAPTDAVLGNDAAMAFLNHPKVKDWFNRWNFIPGTITIAAIGNVIEYGFIPALGMRLYTVNEWFIDPLDLTEKEMLDSKTVLLLNRGARTTRLYGAVQHMKSLHGVPRFPWSWETEDPSARWVQLHSCPLPAINQPDAFLAAKVLS